MSDQVETESTPPARPARGFAAMTKERQREIAKRGGKAAHERGTAHEFSGSEAREAGRKGGEAVSSDREYMSKIGREGARKSAIVRGKAKAERGKAKAAEAPAAAAPGDGSKA
jgi:general stress protein YciG